MYGLTEWLSLENVWSTGSVVPPAWEKQKHWESVDGISGNAYKTSCACVACVSLGGSTINSVSLRLVLTGRCGQPLEFHPRS